MQVWFHTSLHFKMCQNAIHNAMQIHVAFSALLQGMLYRASCNVKYMIFFSTTVIGEKEFWEILWKRIVKVSKNLFSIMAGYFKVYQVVFCYRSARSHIKYVKQHHPYAIHWKFSCFRLKRLNVYIYVLHNKVMKRLILSSQKTSACYISICHNTVILCWSERKD